MIYINRIFTIYLFCRVQVPPKSVYEQLYTVVFFGALLNLNSKAATYFVMFKMMALLYYELKDFTLTVTAM